MEKIFEIKREVQKLESDLEYQIKEVSRLFEEKSSKLKKEENKETLKISNFYKEEIKKLKRKEYSELSEAEVRYHNKRVRLEEKSLKEIRQHNANFRKKKKELADEYEKSLKAIKGNYILLWFNKRTATSTEILFEDITVLRVDEMEIKDTMEISEIISRNCVGITYRHSKNNSLPKFIRTREGRSYRYEFPENYGIQKIDEKIYDQVKDLIYNTETGERYLMMGEKLKIIKDLLKESGYKEKTIIID